MEKAPGEISVVLEASQHRTAPGLAAPADALVGVARTRSFFPELEALRGVAVVLVFLFHVDGYVLWGQTPANSLLTNFMRAGHTGVDLFFLLSGFLLGLPFVADGLGGPRVSLSRYAARRALRILPLYYVAVVVGTVLSAGSAADLLRGVPYLFFLNGISGMAVPMLPYSAAWWSLTTEMEFYLLLPLLPLALRGRRGRIVGLLVLLAYAAAYVALVRGWLVMPTVAAQLLLMLSLFGRGPLFLSGILAAWLYHMYGAGWREQCARSRWLKRGGGDLLLAALLLALALLMRELVAMGYHARMGHMHQWWHIPHGALWAAVLLLLLLAPLHTKRLICNPVLARLGVLSYSIYILHVPFMAWGLKAARSTIPGLFGWTPRTIVVVVLLSSACYAASTQTYRWIERPFLVRKSRFE